MKVFFSPVGAVEQSTCNFKFYVNMLSLSKKELKCYSRCNFLDSRS